MSARLIEAAREAISNEHQDGSAEPLVRADACALLVKYNTALQKELARTYSDTRRSLASYGPKHHALKTEEHLSAATLKDLRTGANRGSLLVGNVIAADYPVHSALVQMVVQDAEGWHIMLSIHHASQQAYWKDLRLCVREPLIKLDRDGLPFIRVDCPLDVTTLQSNSILIRSNLRLKQSNSVSALKDQANAEFKAGRFRRAIWLAKEALLEGTNPVVILNLIAYYLAIGFTVNADVQATLLLESPTRSDLSPSQVDKLYWRAAVAKYRNGQYKECIGLLNAAKINSHDQSGQQLELQAQAHLRLVEQKGQYDLPKLYKDMVEGSLTLGEYTNAEIAVQNIPGKGRGIVATSALAPGTLLMVARPIACSQQTQITAKLQALDLTTESISSEAHSSLPDLILARVKDDPSLWPRIRTLYAGPSFETTDREQPVDVGFVECACAYNAFKPESIANTPSSQETTSPGSALYSLPSMVNHACSGNAVYCFYGDYYALRTITKINPGQEITASYVDPCLPYEERARKLKHHTKACDCRLCAEDRLDDPKARHKRDSLIASAGIDVASQLDKAVVSGSASPSLVKKVRVYVEALEHTYGHNLTPRRMYRPQMYAAYRMLSRAIDVSSESKDINALMLAEVKGLECLGLVVDYKTFAKEGLAYPKFLDTPWPILLNQNFVLSAMRVGNLLKRIGPAAEACARQWLDVAQTAHDYIVGKGLLETRLGNVEL